MNILTFDIEEWFHLLANTNTKTEKEWANFESRIHQNMDRILDFLDERNQKATFFCLGWIAKKYPEVIREIDQRGFEIGSHTQRHQLIYEQRKEEFRDDLQASVHILEDITGKKVSSFRAPGFSLTSDVLWALDELILMGIDIDSSIFPAQRAHGGISSFGVASPHVLHYNGINIKEFPINIKSIFGRKIVFSGGGYFRLFPYCLLKNWTAKASYVMTYFHPRDFDNNQPMIESLSLVRKFKSYYGLNGAMYKLEKYTNDFEFVDLKRANELIDWNQVPVVEIS